jgi:hypothetical protein
MTRANPYPLRVDKLIMEKFKIIASNNGRSVNKEIEMLMKQVIADYERNNGLIEAPALNE